PACFSRASHRALGTGGQWRLISPRLTPRGRVELYKVVTSRGCGDICAGSGRRPQLELDGYLEPRRRIRQRQTGMMQLRDGRHQSQTQAMAGGGTAVRNAVEASQYLSMLLRRNPGTVIAHRDGCPVGGHAEAQS